MSFGFMGGAYNHATGTLAAFTGLSAALEAEGFPAMVSKSGDREPEDQLALWYQRMTLDPGNRKVYGTTRWGGRIWYRIHPDKVGIPGTSNHERRRSNDLAYPYNDASTKAHKRAQALAPKFGITWEGKAFSEAWHWTFWGALGTITTPSTAGTVTPITPAQPEEEEDDMKLLYVTDSVDGNGVPGWALLNARTGKLVTMRADDPANQARANSWARVWGDARSCTRQDMLNAIAAIQQTA